MGANGQAMLHRIAQIEGDSCSTDTMEAICRVRAHFLPTCPWINCSVNMNQLNLRCTRGALLLSRGHCILTVPPVHKRPAMCAHEASNMCR